MLKAKEEKRGNCLPRAWQADEEDVLKSWLGGSFSFTSGHAGDGRDSRGEGLGRLSVCWAFKVVFGLNFARGTAPLAKLAPKVEKQLDADKAAQSPSCFIPLVNVKVFILNTFLIWLVFRRRWERTSWSSLTGPPSKRLRLCLDCYESSLWRLALLMDVPAHFGIL